VVEFEAPSRPSAVAGIRERVRRFARRMPFTLDELDDIRVAVGEACTNAVKHGHNPLHPRINIRLERHPDALRVFVTDHGPGFDPATVCPPRAQELCEFGRGIVCMRGLMDEVVFHRLDPGMRVELVKHANTTQKPG
jgi:serine/threonine-protein kinase RsbW